MPFSLRRLLRLLRDIMTLPAADDAAVSKGERRQWEPPFDASRPAPPISYPITDLAALASRSYLSEDSNFHLPFNRASTLLPSPGASLPPRRRLLVCHDFQGGYRDDAAPQGGANPDAYALWHWHLVDVFVYFSHYLVTLPPPCWTNAAHLHGVKVLGTFITEWDKGAEICREMFATQDSAQMYAERLAELAAALGFDGWLINIEVKLDIQFIDNLKEFVNHLTKRMHAAVPGSLVIWYDAITVGGDLDWQDKLNEHNKPFFDLCDGLFVNYTWKEKYPRDSAATAGDRKYDVYMGIDVFGRNTFGGGQWNTNVALDLLKKDDVSTAIFAPGWIYETKQQPDFQTAQNRWWGLVEKSWDVLRSYPKRLPFYSDFDQGHGYQVSSEGLQVSGDPWNNISCQSFQPMLKYTGDEVQPPVQTSINFKDEPYNGGDCVTVQGSLKQNAIFSEQLFNVGLSMEDGYVHLFYSVNAEANSDLGLSLDFSSRNKENTSILIAEDIATFSRKKQHRLYSSYVQSDKVEPHAPDNQNWVIYRATVQSSASYTLIGINIVCTLKTSGKMNSEADEDGSSEEDANRSWPYHASLGHISIRNMDKNTQFPSAESWVTEGKYISWSNNSNTSKLLSLKISWKLNTSHQASFMKYNIYVEKLIADSNAKVSRSFLGVATVEAFYVSDLQVPDEVTSLKFIIQACGCDGSRQGLKECPKLFLVPVE
ncbi:cytosolic endo-beta-N-acetylglucosaminidase 1-like [Triticum dicoccoides]|uniref:cytosolic endo-beta-N-acetylglucosaminidase 1-like n=1 Tax=Triticum dicoccoides TaxID=85692 RepID=UPI000E7894A6|nr:cytosolic endo-beta-N-acetylglucosaminidase 1-like [Triticum dicoccoides]